MILFPELSQFYPSPTLTHIENRTPFTLMYCDKMGPGRRFYDVMVLKASFVLSAGPIRFSETPTPIHYADEMWASPHPTCSSLRIAGDLHLAKPGLDVLVRGHARPSAGKPLHRWRVNVQLLNGHDVWLEHSLRVTGPRWWQHRLLRGWTLSEPEPTDAVPIRYELAFGGSWVDPNRPSGRALYDENPSGCGMISPDQRDVQRPIQAPQWELEGHSVRGLGEEVPVAGLGPIARAWPSRRRYAGTYDTAWRAEAAQLGPLGVPLDYPKDFDPHFFQCAPIRQQLHRPLLGNTFLRLEGLLPQPDPLWMPIPHLELTAQLSKGVGTSERHLFRLDTLEVDVDARTLACVWRLVLPRTLGFTHALLEARRSL